MAGRRAAPASIGYAGCDDWSMTSTFENEGPSVVKVPIFSAIATVSGSALLMSAASLDGNVTITTYSSVSRSRPSTSLVYVDRPAVSDRYCSVSLFRVEVGGTEPHDLYELRHRGLLHGVM